MAFRRSSVLPVLSLTFAQTKNRSGTYHLEIVLHPAFGSDTTPGGFRDVPKGKGKCSNNAVKDLKSDSLLVVRDSEMRLTTWRSIPHQHDINILHNRLESSCGNPRTIHHTVIFSFHMSRTTHTLTLALNRGGKVWF